MKYQRLGNTGLEVSAFALGCMSYGEPGRGQHGWTLDEDESRPFIRTAVEAGINFFDTANAYSDGRSEEIVGRALNDFANRDEIVLATKVCNPVGTGPNQRGLSRKAIHQELDNSLRRLGTDYVDLYIIHRFDPYTPVEETLVALDEVVCQGKVRYLGASSMATWQFAVMLGIQRAEQLAPFISMQSQYNLLAREDERELIPLCADQRIGLTPWSPLARGRLTRDWDAGSSRLDKDDVASKLYKSDDDSNRRIVNVVAHIAEARGISRAQVALAWLLGAETPNIPIVGATKIHHLDDAQAAVDVVLSVEERTLLEAAYTPRLPEPM